MANEVNLLMDELRNRINAQLRDFKEVREGEFVVLWKRADLTWGTHRAMIDTTVASAVPSVKLILGEYDLTEEAAIANFNKRS